MNIFLDIETIPAQRKDIRAYVADKVTHPGNISKAETIAKWNEESRPAAVEEAINKTGLDGAFGQVCCVGLDLLDCGEAEVLYGLDEHLLLTQVNDIINHCIKPANNYNTRIIGHNVSSFDLRFLVQRYIVNGIKPHIVIARAASAKPWEDEKVYDTMVQFAGVGNRISLDKLCLALGLPGKGDIDGSMVAGMVAAGRIKEVADYCASDVNKTRAVFRRMTFVE
ncbi:Predicted 3'-5' exonuclease, PolB-like [uncultured Caudovirales phage]|uniref:Predicted 3'-5' exonuclease, PolB-like n=1 Tax=uncultured Caudovirales phage TaxID=2100421 RepID=A0A6J5KHP6_9CAUD|nr:Predicted 3'-5' exonuclease, PolB-like [uncultured Caudovirales phage]